MRIAIHAVGKLKAGPERELADRYLDRADKAGRGIGFSSVTAREIVESRAREALQRKEEEARELLSDLPPGALLIALDERGDSPTSERFAEMLGEARDRGDAKHRVADRWSGMAMGRNFCRGPAIAFHLAG